MNFDWLSPELARLLLGGFWVTIFLTAVTTLLAFLIGVAVGGMRLSKRSILQLFATVYIEIFRNIPALVIIIFFAFAVPNLFPIEQRQAIFFDNALADGLKALTGLSLPYYAIAALAGITFNASAYIAELFRAGVKSLPQNTVDVAQTLGATEREVYRRILRPHGVKAAFPAMSTRFIHTMKNTALASFVTVPEFFMVTQTAITRSFQAIQLLLLATAVYLFLAFAFSALLQQIDRRLI
ncbi:MAG: amino acid ABC transporter permease [Chloroflexota bacterium]